jgi:hypothetical protein
MSVTINNKANSIKLAVYSICPVLTRFGMPSIKEAYHANPVSGSHGDADKRTVMMKSKGAFHD